MKVAITDYTFDSLDIETGILAPAGCHIDSQQCKKPAEVIDLVAEADYVITQFAPLTAEVIHAMRKVKLIVRYGIGVDNVDLEAAFAKGISVCNVPDYCIDEVADHTLAFVLAATRRVVENAKLVRSGRWGLAVPLESMKALRDMTVGVVGFGRIGREVLKRLRPFKCNLLVYDPFAHVAEIEELDGSMVEFEELLSQSDLVTLHCPSTPETQGLLGRKAISQIKPGAILVNVARGGLVDTAALIEALQVGGIGFAALDVCDPEPIPAGNPLLELENVLLASHIASCSVNAERTSRETAAQTIVRAIQGEPLRNIVNGVEPSSRLGIDGVPK